MEVPGMLSLLLVLQIFAKVTSKPVNPSRTLQSFQLICDRERIQVGVNVTEMASFSLNASSGNLAVYSCSNHAERNGIVWYEVKTVEGACGNILTLNATHFIYSNSLFIYRISKYFTTPVDFPFSCAFPLDTDASLALKPFPDLNGSISGSGAKAKAIMTLYEDPGYYQVYPPGTVTLPVGSPLYVKIIVEERDPRFYAVLEDCYTTYTPNPEDTVGYYLFQDKCPVDNRLMAGGRRTSLQIRFTALLFLFENKYRDVYLHCSISLCYQPSSSCVPDCIGRAKRAVSSSELLEPVTIGPITWGKTPE